MQTQPDKDLLRGLLLGLPGGPRPDLFPVFEPLSWQDRISLAESMFLSVESLFGHDEKVLEAFNLVIAICRTAQISSFLSVSKLYWQSSPEVNCDSAHAAVLVQTKLAMCKQAGYHWKPDGTPESLEAFHFLAAAFGVLRQSSDLPEDTNYRIKMAAGRYVSEKEKDGILEIVKSATRDFPRDKISFWMRQKWLPKEFAEILAVRFADGHGKELVLEVEESRGLLRDFVSCKRSDSAKQCLRIVAGQISWIDRTLSSFAVRAYGAPPAGTKFASENPEIYINSPTSAKIIFDVVPENSNLPEDPEGFEKWLGDAAYELCTMLAKYGPEKPKFGIFVVVVAKYHLDHTKKRSTTIEL